MQYGFDESNPYKNLGPAEINYKVGLMNQTPTKIQLATGGGTL